MASGAESPKRELTPALTIPQKRVLDDGHFPAISSPLNPNLSTDPPPVILIEDAPSASRLKSGRPKKDSIKKREAKGIESARATPDPSKSTKEKETVHTELSPLRYRIAPPKLSDFDPPRGPVLTFHHKVTDINGDEIDFFESSDQCVEARSQRNLHESWVGWPRWD